MLSPSYKNGKAIKPYRNQNSCKLANMKPKPKPKPKQKQLKPCEACLKPNSAFKRIAGYHRRIWVCKSCATLKPKLLQTCKPKLKPCKICEKPNSPLKSPKNKSKSAKRKFTIVSNRVKCPSTLWKSISGLNLTTSTCSNCKLTKT